MFGFGLLADPLSGLWRCFLVLDLGRMLDLGISNGTAVAVGLGARKKKLKKKLRMRVRSRRRRRPTVAWGVSSV